ncbi:MAG: preprotein translocase subunit SecG [Oscillospiraceae bacterium]|nr:preprotein translocase subunit SecG [Oscillospiraceae bacterium]
METLKTVLIVTHLLIAAILIFVVLAQESKTGGLSQGISGGSTDTFFGSNKSKTTEAIMRRWTAICAIAFIVISFVLAFIIKSGV